MYYPPDADCVSIKVQSVPLNAVGPDPSSRLWLRHSVWREVVLVEVEEVGLGATGSRVRHNLRKHSCVNTASENILF